jgi:hypothetical protein
MADEPFALSTVMPATPADADYDTLCAAVMETARGRWFLQEFARRNRHADTERLLEAIARLRSVAGPNQAGQAGDGLREDLLEMARTIAHARAEGAPTAAGDPARATGDIIAAAERLMDVAWTMRERGLDMATCDQIESLAKTLLAAAAVRDQNRERAHLLGNALHDLEQRIGRMIESPGMAAAGLPDGTDTTGLEAAADTTSSDGAAGEYPAQHEIELLDSPPPYSETAPELLLPADSVSASSADDMPIVALVTAPVSRPQASSAPEPATLPDPQILQPDFDTVMPAPDAWAGECTKPDPEHPASDRLEPEPADFLLGPLPAAHDVDTPASAIEPEPQSSPAAAAPTGQRTPGSTAEPVSEPHLPPAPAATLTVQPPVVRITAWLVPPSADDSLGALSAMSDEERIAIFT